jgi:hypothetical protein
MKPESDPPTSSASLGAAQAREFVAALRGKEDRAIERRLEVLTAAPGGEFEEEGATPTEVARLRKQVQELAAFRAAVLGSRPWFWIQAARRLCGRAW